MSGQGESSCARSLKPVCVFVCCLFNERVSFTSCLVSPSHVKHFELPRSRKVHYKLIWLHFFIYTSMCFSKMCSDRNQNGISFWQVWLLDIVFIWYTGSDSDARTHRKPEFLLWCLVYSWSSFIKPCYSHKYSAKVGTFSAAQGHLLVTSVCRLCMHRCTFEAMEDLMQTLRQNRSKKKDLTKPMIKWTGYQSDMKADRSEQTHSRGAGQRGNNIKKDITGCQMAA